MSMSHDVLSRSLDLIQRGAGRRLILPGGGSNVYCKCTTHVDRCFCAWSVSQCPDSFWAKLKKRMPKRGRCLLLGIIRSCSIEMAQMAFADSMIFVFVG